MNSIKKKFGSLLYSFSRGLDKLVTFLIEPVEAILNLLKGLRTILIIFFFVGGIVFILLISVFKAISGLIFIFILLPLLLQAILGLLYFIKNGLVEYLYARSKYLTDGFQMKFGGPIEYYRDYRKREEERAYREAEARRRAYEEQRRRAYEEQRRRAQQQWEEFFGQSTNFGGGFGGYSGQGGFSGVTDLGFKEKYESACKTLNIGYNTSKDEVRTAFRKMAKQYHPDLNKAENATEIFQKINDANEFLTEENINRYKNMN